MIRAMLIGGAAPPTDPEPPRELPPLPERDATTMAMRPDVEPLATYVVALDGTGDYDNLNTAAKAAKDRQDVACAIKGIPAPTPRERVEIRVKPGHHVADMRDLGTWVSVIATDPTPGSTSLTNSAAGPWAGGTIAPGDGVYWEGIDLHDVPGGYDPKYPAHPSLGGGTLILTHCSFDNRNPGSGGGAWTVGTDVGAGCTVVLHDVDLVSGRTNQHGWQANTAPITLVYSQVRSPKGEVDLWDQGSGQPDEIWVVGCDVQGVRVQAPNGIQHLDPATRIGSLGVVSNAATRDTRTDWPIPTGGLSARDRARYGM